MNKFVACCLLFSGAYGATGAAGYDPTISDTGFSGYNLIPSADLADEGVFHLSYSEALPAEFSTNYVDSENYAFTLGFTSWLELGGRLISAGEKGFGAGTSTFYFQGAAQRDLSTNLKIQLWDRASWPKLALGVQDASGNNNFASAYGVASYRYRMVEATVGYGTQRIDGLFYGLRVDLGTYLRVLIDDDTTQSYVSTEADTGNLFSGLRLYARYRVPLGGVNASSGWMGGVSLHLGKVHKVQSAYSGNIAAVDPEGSRAVLAKFAYDIADDTYQLAERLKKIGIERVVVQRIDDSKTLVVSGDGRRFPNSSIDALGVMLSASALAMNNISRLVVQLTKNGAPQFWVQTMAADVREALLDPSAPPPKFDFALGRSPEVEKLGVHPGAVADVWLSPALRYALATELSVLDYSVGVETQINVPLWRGATAYAEGTDDIASTYNFRAGYLGATVPSGWQNRGIQQTLGLWGLGAFRVHAGRSSVFGYDTTYQVGELVVMPWAGSGLQLETRFAEFRRHGYGRRDKNLYPESRESWVGSARYYWADQQTLVDLTWGRFSVEDDEGGRFKLERFYGDASVAILYLRDASKENEALGVRFSAPLGPSRSTPLGRFALSGRPNWGTTLQTTINTESNFLKPGLLLERRPRDILRDTYFDRGRLSRNYIQNAWPNMRSAFMEYVTEH